MPIVFTTGTNQFWDERLKCGNCGTGPNARNYRWYIHENQGQNHYTCRVCKEEVNKLAIFVSL